MKTWRSKRGIKALKSKTKVRDCKGSLREEPGRDCGYVFRIPFASSCSGSKSYSDGYILVTLISSCDVALAFVVAVMGILPANASRKESQKMHRLLGLQVPCSQSHRQCTFHSSGPAHLENPLHPVYPMHPVQPLCLSLLHLS